MSTRLIRRTAGAAIALVRRLARALDVRRQRRALLLLDDRRLKDIGLTRFDAWREGNRALFDLPGEIGAHNRSCSTPSSRKQEIMSATQLSPTRRQLIASSASASGRAPRRVQIAAPIDPS
jgi:uncharacterized protein YjiS (DUF1127 family)